MRYSIINTSQGEKCGFTPNTHRLTNNGQKMVVNENELRTVGEDIATVARMLGGVLMTRGEVINELNREEKT